MSDDLADDSNPFAPPSSLIGHEVARFEGDSTDAEIIRLAHLGREATIKAVGFLSYFVAAIFLLLFVVLVGMLLSGADFSSGPANQQVDPRLIKLILGVSAAIYFTIGVVGVALGYGLRRLQVWSRWLMIVLASLTVMGGLLYSVAVASLVQVVAGVFVFVVACVVPAYFLYLMVSPQGGMVFSPEYKEIIARTPHLRYETSLIAKIALAIALVILVIVIAFGLFGGFSS